MKVMILNNATTARDINPLPKPRVWQFCETDNFNGLYQNELRRWIAIEEKLKDYSIESIKWILDRPYVNISNTLIPEWIELVPKMYYEAKVTEITKIKILKPIF
ncbi:MAG TPA: hypothetical protein DCQ93_03965 [Bacteroidetes bacterium]|nr:hypothetical protein [Bacteroidota bacterium]